MLSDLHLEFAPFEIPAPDADVVILAGDVAPGFGGMGLALRELAGRPVIYVAGNHEYYGHSLPALTEQFRAAAQGTHVHFLENSEVVLRGVRFLGCTLWTDFGVWGKDAQPLAAWIAGQAMNDFRLIQWSRANRPLLPTDVQAIHRRSRTWLARKLAERFDGPTVVVTHHGPSLRSLVPANRDDLLTPAYVSDLESCLDGRRVALWIRGHTHRSVDYTLHGTRVLSNQRGYPDQTGTGFDARLVVTV